MISDKTRAKLSAKARETWTNPAIRAKREKHGLYKTPEYRIWQAMTARCRTTARETLGQRYYAHRGITVCERWRISFVDFYADMGPRPSPVHSIERRDNDGSYAPDNCYWATRIEQSLNTRRNLRLTVNGETKPAAAWAAIFGVPQHVIRRRVHDGWPHERAVKERRHDNIVPKRPRNRYTA